MKKVGVKTPEIYSLVSQTPEVSPQHFKIDTYHGSKESIYLKLKEMILESIGIFLFKLHSS